MSRILSFNNCSIVNYEEVAPELKSLSEGPIDPNADHETTLTDAAAEAAIQNLPPAERDIYRPISDLDKDPELERIFSA